MCTLLDNSLLDNHLIKLQLDSLPLHDLLFDSALGDKPIDVDLFCLPDPVSPVHCLQVNLRVPV